MPKKKTPVMRASLTHPTALSHLPAFSCLSVIPQGQLAVGKGEQPELPHSTMFDLQSLSWQVMACCILRQSLLLLALKHEEVPLPQTFREFSKADGRGTVGLVISDLWMWSTGSPATSHGPPRCMQGDKHRSVWGQERDRASGTLIHSDVGISQNKLPLNRSSDSY